MLKKVSGRAYLLQQGASTVESLHSALKRIWACALELQKVIQVAQKGKKC